MRKVLRTQAAADYIGMSASWLEKCRRKRNVGPRWFRQGAKIVGYDVSDLDEWISSCSSAPLPPPAPESPTEG